MACKMLGCRGAKLDSCDSLRAGNMRPRGKGMGRTRSSCDGSDSRVVRRRQQQVSIGDHDPARITDDGATGRDECVGGINDDHCRAAHTGAVAVCPAHRDGSSNRLVNDTAEHE